MAALVRQATSFRPIVRAESRSTQQTLFHLVPSSSSCAAKIVPVRHFERRARLSPAPAAATNEAARTQGPSGDEASKEFAVSIARVVDEVKCTDIVVLDVAPVVSWTSFLVVATVFSKPQLLAALSRVEKAASEQFGRARLNLPGSSPWETLDFGDVVLHLFTAEQREYYDIESFYAAAEEVELPFGPDGAAGRRDAPGPGSAGQPPAWTTRL